ncbi:Ni/Fe hydrogenase subunit alpha [bacterium]|nr:Ni/Fe hydrogenase subunit alpha [bacterium]
MKKKIIKTISRVEGHGGISVTFEGKKVKEVRVNIYEGPRLIEQLVLGKAPGEIINIVPRICGICSLSHKLAAINALENALDIKVPMRTKLTRELMLIGEILQSNALHVFYLSLPDFLGYPSVVEMIADYPGEVEAGMTLKGFGYQMNRLLSGRPVHGENPVLGGFGKHPSNKDLLDLKNSAAKLMPLAEKAAGLFGIFDYPAYLDQDTTFIALNPDDGKYGFAGNSIRISNGDEFPVPEYKSVVNERVVPYSFAKRASYLGKPFSVGALARINLFGERLTGKAGQYFSDYYNKRWKKNPLYFCFAQALEIIFCLENIPLLVDRIVGLKVPDVVIPKRQNGIGTGAVEAPRGALYHHYELKDGLASDCDISTPTAQNLDDIERYLFKAADHLIGEPNEKKLEFKLEMIARAFDPCISCSAHMIKIIRK